MVDFELRVTTHQWPAAHGGFHTQSCELTQTQTQRSKRFTFVYDCGSKGRAAHLKGMVTDYLLQLKRPVIDRFVISHFDEDHVNRATYLLNEAARLGIEVREVLAPALTGLEKVVLLARQSKTASQQYVSLVSDPEGWAEEHFPSALYTGLRPDGQRIEVPNEGTPPDGAEEPPRPIRSLYRYPSGGAGLGASHFNHSISVLWEFVPFVQPWVVADRAKLWGDILAAASTAPLPSDADRLDRFTIEDLIQQERTVIRKVFQNHRKHGSNFSSLCYYSGPSPFSPLQPVTVSAQLGQRPVPVPGQPLGEGGWLGTGDSGFGSSVAGQKNVQELQNYYGPQRLSRVGLVTVPHHGSRYDSSPDFWTSLPGAEIATFHASGLYGHPTQSALHYAQSAGVFNAITGTGNSSLETSAFYTD